MKKTLLLLTITLLAALPLAVASNYWHDDTRQQYRYDHQKHHDHHVRPIILTNYGYHTNAWRYRDTIDAYDHPYRYSTNKRFYRPHYTRYGNHYRPYNRGHVNVYYR